MSPPTKQQVKVATDSLRTEAGTWDHNSAQMATIVGATEGLDLTRLEAGIFQIIVSAYGSVVDQVTARCSEGQQRMSEIADTLRHVATTYEEEDQKGVHAFKNLW